MSQYADRLRSAMESKGSRLVLGLDPDVARVRRITSLACLEAPDALVRFCKGILAACCEYVCATKIQVAFFECYGSDGWRALEIVCAEARARSLLVILDAKRGDVASTANAYARLLAPDGPLGGVDAITVNPYLGSDSVQPFLEACDSYGAGIYVLVKTSNPGSADLQDLRLADQTTLCEAVADLVVKWGAGRVGAGGWSSVGAVVGATHPQDAARLRERMPYTPFLLPGVGAQGAEVATLRPAFGADGYGACVSASRSILYAWEEHQAADPHLFDGAAARAAERLRNEINAVVGD